MNAEMSVINRPNFTQIPNVFLDDMAKNLNESELRVMLAIIRKTFGWQKTRDRISLSQLQELTGLSRQGVLNGLYGSGKNQEQEAKKGIVNKGYVRIFQTELGNEFELVVNQVDQQEEPASQPSRLEVVNEVDQQGQFASQPSRHTKESNINKDINKRVEPAKAVSSEVAQVHEHYQANYKALYEQGRVQSENVVNNYAATGRLIKELLKDLNIDQLKKVLDNAMNDDWIISGAYSLQTILSKNQTHRLLNAKPARKHKIKADEVVDYEQYIAKV